MRQAPLRMASQAQSGTMKTQVQARSPTLLGTRDPGLGAIPVPGSKKAPWETVNRRGVKGERFFRLADSVGEGAATRLRRQAVKCGFGPEWYGAGLTHCPKYRGAGRTAKVE